MTPPIIIAAFGSTSKAREIYARVDALFKTRFSGHAIHWAFTSRIVRHHLKKRSVNRFPPNQVVAQVAAEGHNWTVVQSFNMICGHEFYRLVNDTQHPDCRVSVGHSLLCSQQDHLAVARSLAPIFARDDREAVVFVGHGTDHCSWTTYPAFYALLEEIYGKRAYGGMVEEGFPDRDQIIERVKQAGFRRVRIVPFMLVAGVHFEEDLIGPEDSWRTAFEEKGLDVTWETEALGARPPIIELFCEHIQSALSVIPDVDGRTVTQRVRECTPGSTSPHQFVV